MPGTSEPPVPGPRDGIEAANAMTDTLGEFVTELQKLSKRDRRSRLFLRILAVTFCVDIAITVGLGITSVQTRENSQAIHQSQITGCQTFNVRLAKQEAAIDAILQPAANLSPAQRAAAEKYLAADRARISGAWAPKDCAKAYKLP